MKKTFKYRINANRETIAKAENWLWLCHNLYNCALEQRIDAYKRQRISISGYTQANELPEIKQDNPEYRLIGSQVLQGILERLDKAYKAFFRRVKQGGIKAGFPRFKGKNRFDSFTLKNAGWTLDGRFLSIRNIGRFKMRLSRPIQGDIKTITIRRSPTNHWYACFSCDDVPERKLPQSNKVAGLDVGIKSFLVDSEGNPPIGNPKYLKHALKELRVRQRKLAKAKKGSNRRKDTKLQLSKCYEKIANQRSDFHHKLANEYIKNYGLIVFEKLQIRNMVKNHCLARDINDAAWGQFFEYLDYKAEEAGRLIFKDNPRNTSKKCHICGAINKDLKLSDREWVCQSCGTVHDRDFNAAMNHKLEGTAYLKRLGYEPSDGNVVGCYERSPRIPAFQS
jgi:putative transposase